jgi:hypothetical protein
VLSYQHPNPQQKCHPDRSRSEVEGPAVHQHPNPQQKCHPDRSEAKWRDLLLIIRGNKSEWQRRPLLCHPDRSEAKWRDLQFRGPILEMFSTEPTDDKSV